MQTPAAARAIICLSWGGAALRHRSKQRHLLSLPSTSRPNENKWLSFLFSTDNDTKVAYICKWSFVTGSGVCVCVSMTHLHAANFSLLWTKQTMLRTKRTTIPINKRIKNKTKKRKKRRVAVSNKQTVPCFLQNIIENCVHVHFCAITQNNQTKP